MTPATTRARLRRDEIQTRLTTIRHDWVGFTLEQAERNGGFGIWQGGRASNTPRRRAMRGFSEGVGRNSFERRNDHTLSRPIPCVNPPPSTQPQSASNVHINIYRSPCQTFGSGELRGAAGRRSPITPRLEPRGRISPGSAALDWRRGRPLPGWESSAWAECGHFARRA